MAEAVVGAIIEVLVGKVLTLAEEQISLGRHFKDDLGKFGESLAMVQAFLHDAEKKKVTNSAVKLWLRELEDLAFDADNVIDDIEYILLSKKAKNLSLNKKVQSLFSSSPISHRLKMGSRIKVINERLEKINQRATTFGLESRLAREQDVLDAYVNRETDAFSVDPIFLGRENEVLEIVKMLTTASPAGQKSSSYVLPIVGMGGQGKTTFAREVFHDERIKSHFGDKNRVWVYVSQNFDVRNILKNILASITCAEKFELETQQVLLQKLQEHLGAKKYLLVLDDVWNEDRVKWDDFENSLSGISSANGYSMIVTTRSEEVASIVKTFDVHNLKGLTEDDCWSIIKAKAFRGGDVMSDVEEIGKKIARKCQGLPLAAKVVGGVMSSMKSKDEWSSIEENWLSNLEDKNPISNVLKLSFDHLTSPSLKKCFAYCSIFPKGYNIRKDQLVELWMAEGFLQTNHQIGNNIDMETTGRNNFNILLRKSLLQCVWSDGYGNVTHCNMHDLVHDLACSVLCEGVCKSRYIGYKPSGDGFLSITKGEERYVRTLFFDGKISDIKFSDFESLHTLTLVRKDTDNLPTSIRKLKHLRYLDISQTKITCLSDSIGELYHLQTLRTVMWSKMEKLPNSLSFLISLRHLHISFSTPLPPEIGKLTRLQTLPYYHVGGEKGCEISELGNLKHLKGELEIRNLEKVSDKNEAMRADLLQKPGIYKLKLVWAKSRHKENNEGKSRDEAKEESVLECLQPHPNLKILEICGFKGKSLPLRTSKMVAQLDGHCYWEGLDNLVKIKLEGCSKCEELPMFGQLQNLKHLYLSGLANVKSIKASFYGIDNLGNDNGVCTINVVSFPALKELELVGMKNLKEWDDVPALQPSEVVVVVFPRLQYLIIFGCEKLMRVPSHFPCLEKLTIEKMESSLPLENICGMKLTTLTHLRIWGITELECLPDGLFSNNHNLNKLEIGGCPKMTHLVPLVLRGGGTRPSLKELRINWCGILKELPDDLHSLTSLETLIIQDCPHLKSLPSRSGGGGQQQQQQEQGLSSLKSLTILDCVGLRNLPIEMLESCALSLKKLTLNGLTNSPEVIGCLHKITSLKSLIIRGLPKLSIINSGIQMVSSLKCLDMGPSMSDWDNVDSFNETVDAMLLQFTSLRELTLRGMEHWECLPDGIQHLTSLQKLSLDGFGIEALPEWFGNLSSSSSSSSSLKTLSLCNCKKLRHLPSKQAMQRLSRLSVLYIDKCPLLLKELRRSKSMSLCIGGSPLESELAKISHIPTVDVGDGQYHYGHLQ